MAFALPAATPASHQEAIAGAIEQRVVASGLFGHRALLDGFPRCSSCVG